MWLARALVETKKTERIDSLISPDDPAMTPALLFTLGGLFAEHRMYREAARFLSRIPERDADDAVYFNLGEAYSHLQEFEKARVCYFHAIDKHPGHVEAYFHVGLDYASSGQPRKSAPWLAQAHQLAPQRSDISYALAEQLINLEYFDSADELLKKAARDQPDNALILTACGDLKSAEGQADAAIRIYEDALVKTPGLIQALIGLAHVQITQVKYEEAQQSLELALSEAPDNAAVEGALGLLENKQQHWDAAAVHLENAWKADHGNSQIALELARAYRQTGKLSDALRLLTSIEPALRQSPAFHLEFSQLYRQMHRADESKAELDAFNALQKREENSLRFDKPRTYVF
jgi:tetratricopeptide (TPR) repeat protein